MTKGRSRTAAASVVFVEPHFDNIVPAGRVVALETLVHTRILLVGELLGDHRKVPHEVTRRREVALHAFFSFGGWVFVATHRPRLESVALRAVASESLEMRILAVVAGGAIERFARGILSELTGPLNPEPGL